MLHQEFKELPCKFKGRGVCVYLYSTGYMEMATSEPKRVRGFLKVFLNKVTNTYSF